MDRQRALLWVAIISTILALVYVLGLIADWPVWLRGVEWVWVRRVPANFGTRWWLIGGMAVGWLALLMWVIYQRGEWTKWQTWALIGAFMLFTFIMPLAVAAQHRSQPLSIAFLATITPTAGFFTEGVQIADPQSFIQEHSRRMPGYRGAHLQTHPPGWPISFWAVKQGWELFPQLADRIAYRLLRYDCTSTDLQGLSPAQISAATLQMGLLLLGSVGVFPLYLLARDEFSPYVARLAVVSYALLPGILVFQARFDVLYAVLTLIALWLARRAFYHQRWREVLLLAFLLAGVTLFAFGPLVIVLLVDAFLLAHVLLWNRTWSALRRLLRINLAILVALILVWVMPWFLWRASWLQMFLIGREIHHQVRISQPLWPLFNLYDLGVFMGLPFLVWIVARGIAIVMGITSRKPGDALVLGWILFLLLLNFSGEVRAEAGRLWLFLIVPGMLVGVGSLVNFFPQQESRIQHPESAYRRSRSFRFQALITAFVLVVFGVQAVVTALYLGNRVPIQTAPQALWSVPRSATHVAYELGNDIALRGYTIHEQRNDELMVTLYWQSVARTRNDYSVFVHMLEEDGGLLAQSDGGPMDDSLPTWCWVPGEVIADSHVLSGLREVPGPYQIGVGMYDWRTGERLPVTPLVRDQIILLPLK